jgi:regulator of protease activity HflC (stomatin/prohibitin superfamily)
MKFIKVIMALIGLLGLSLAVLWGMFERIEPGQIGVRQSIWGSSGVMNEDFQAGYHWGVTGMHKWHLLDRRTHFLTFSEANSQSGFSRKHRNSQEELPLEIRTSDNNPVSVDVTVAYRIIPGEAHVIVSSGEKMTYQDRVASAVRGVLLGELAKLVPEDFVNTDIRLELAANALPILTESLAALHVEPEVILVRAVRFHERYEEKLQAKQLTQQNAELARSRAKVEGGEMVTGTIEKETEALKKEARAEWDKKLQEASSNNEVRVAEILAEAKIYENQVRPRADAFYETQIAEGKLAIDKAEALRDELRNEALDSLGGRILQARDAAENLNFESVTLNSNDPSIPSVIEIDKLVKLLIGADGSE